MRIQAITHYLLRHRFRAALLSFMVTFVPVFGIVGILYAGLATLRKGAAEGALLMVAATLPYLISFYISGNTEPAAQLVLWAAVGVAVLSNVLTWVFAVMLRRHATWSQILQIAALIGVLVVSVVHLVWPDVANWWGNQLQSYYSYYRQASELTGMLKTDNAASVDAQLDSVNVTKGFATGVMMAAALFNAILQLIVSRWWQAIVFSPGMLRRELHDIRLSQLAGILFVISLVLAYMGNAVVLDMMPILYMLFCAAGLSLIHYVFGLVKSTTRWFWIWLMYVTLIFALPTSIMLVALTALFDIWLNIRQRLKKV